MILHVHCILTTPFKKKRGEGIIFPHGNEMNVSNMKIIPKPRQNSINITCGNQSTYKYFLKV